MASLPTTELKRARPQMNVYTVLLLVALLVTLVGLTVISLTNMTATGQGPFDHAPTR